MEVNHQMRSMFLRLQSFLSPHFSHFPIYNFLVKLSTTDQATTLTPKKKPFKEEPLPFYHNISSNVIGIAYKQQRRSKKVNNIRDSKSNQRRKNVLANLRGWTLDVWHWWPRPASCCFCHRRPWWQPLGQECYLPSGPTPLLVLHPSLSLLCLRNNVKIT